MRIAIGNDHVAYDYKQQITDYVQSLGHETTDFGAHSDERTDYPIWGESVARAVAAGEYDRGILICGSGVGISIAGRCRQLDDVSRSRRALLTLFDVRDLADPISVSATFELAIDPCLNDHLGHFNSDDARSEREDVGVVVFSGEQG